MLNQTRYAVDKLKAAGMHRSEFSVRTYRRNEGMHHGKRMWSYEIYPVITLNCSRDRQFEVVDAIARAGLGVMLYVGDDGHVFYPHITDRFNDEIRVCYLDSFKNTWGGDLIVTIASYV